MGFLKTEVSSLIWALAKHGAKLKQKALEWDTAAALMNHRCLQMRSQIPVKHFGTSNRPHMGL